MHSLGDVAGRGRAAIAAPRPSGGSTSLLDPATLAGGLALVLAFRAVYLARFGHDPCWMNYNFLLEAKAMRFGYAAEYNGMPLVPALLLAGRTAGASAAVAMGAVYLAGHALLAAGILALGRTVLGASHRSRAALAIAVASLPLFATDAGYRNLSCALAAGLLASLAALVLARPEGRPSPARLAGALLLAAAAAACRSEAVLAVAALSVALGVFGRRLGCGRAGAATLAVGLALGLLLAGAWDRRLGTVSSARTYAFYCFYVASPFLLRLRALLNDPASVATEYARYAQSLHLFGGFVENGGSIARALARHPADAAIWLLAKPVDLAVGILSPDSFTPLAVGAFAMAARRARREGLRCSASRWAPVLAAFGAPLAGLLVWAPGHAQYTLVVSPLLLLAALWGLEPAIEAATAPRIRLLGWSLAAAGLLGVALLGHTSPSSSPALEAAARWLERRCARGGCLVNAVPQPVDALAWADLQAGAPFPRRVKRDEAFVLRRYPRQYLEDVRLERRIELARGRGWEGPVLYVRVRVRSFEAFSEDFDPEHALEGAPDLSAAALAAAFRSGPDVVEVLEHLDPRPLRAGSGT